jgi:hypothetical protein
MKLPVPVADAATAAEVRDWLDRFAVCCGRSTMRRHARSGTLISSSSAAARSRPIGFSPAPGKCRRGTGSAFIRTCRWRAACRRIALGNAR